MKIRKLAIGGGGLLGFKYLGVTSKLDLKKVKKYCGCSVGALIVFFLSIGYMCDELFNRIKDVDLMQFMDVKMHNLITEYGFDTGTKLIDYMTLIAIEKIPIITQQTTFIELHTMTKKKLTIVGSCVSTGKAEFFNYKRTPNMPVITALRISISLPIIFTPIMYDGKMYVDGAFYYPNPMKYFKCLKNAIGIIGEYKYSPTHIFPTKTWYDYMYSFMSGLRMNYFDSRMNDDNVIFVDDNADDEMKFGVNFGISQELKQKLFDEGSSIPINKILKC